MFRPATCGVATLSGGVANGRQVMHHVSCSPSKIPYVGFSPVRLQTGIQSRPSPARAWLKRIPRIPTRSSELIRGYSAAVGLLWPLGQYGCAASRTGRTALSSPEALGSPAGCVVPLGHRLLWPHPKLSAPPAGLYSSSWRVFALRVCVGWNRQPPQFTPRVSSLRAAFRTPVDHMAAYVCSFTICSGLRPICTGSASTSPR